MVDVGGKVVTKRTAKAQAVVVLGHAIMQELIKQEFHTKKGSIEQSATIAGTFAVKKTSDLIPLCHPLPIDSCSFNYQRNGYRIGHHMYGILFCQNWRRNGSPYRCQHSSSNRI
jgi:cyclic pyranopterin phosphate synthase